MIPCTSKPASLQRTEVTVTVPGGAPPGTVLAVPIRGRTAQLTYGLGRLGFELWGFVPGLCFS